MDADDGVLAIVLATEHLLDFARLDFGGERAEGLIELGFDRLSSFGPLDEHGQIVCAPLQRLTEVAILLEPPAALQELLRRGLVFPEIRFGNFRLDGGQLGLELRGVKDSSGDRKPASRDPDTAVLARRAEWSLVVDPKQP
jgi:hypothetical protein